MHGEANDAQKIRQNPEKLDHNYFQFTLVAEFCLKQNASHALILDHLLIINICIETFWRINRYLEMLKAKLSVLLSPQLCINLVSYWFCF